MNYIFLTSLFPKELEKEISEYSKGNIANAADVHQWNIVRGFSANVSDNVYVVNAPLVGSYPKFYTKPLVRGCRFSISDYVHGVSVGYINLPIVKHVFVREELESSLFSILDKCRTEKTTIFVYGMYYSYMVAAIKTKREFQNVNLCLIVPDLPEYLANSNGLLFTLRSKLQKDTYGLIKHFDGFVLLTDAMVSRLRIFNNPWIRLEGLIDPEDQATLGYGMKELSTGNRVILYSGTLAERYGILELLDAFDVIKDSRYELWICGAGDTDKIIENRSALDKRIKFFGLISRDKVLALQGCATMLVNPRSSRGDYTKYSFPSKTMEYMLSGKPVVMRRLPGIPDEYKEYIIFTADDSVEMLHNAIVTVGEMQQEHRDEIGRLAREFVLKNKNYIVQGKNLVEFTREMNKWK